MTTTLELTTTNCGGGDDVLLVLLLLLAHPSAFAQRLQLFWFGIGAAGRSTAAARVPIGPARSCGASQCGPARSRGASQCGPARSCGPV